jgi:hypothetical protein
MLTMIFMAGAEHRSPCPPDASEVLNKTAGSI